MMDFKHYDLMAVASSMVLGFSLGLQVEGNHFVAMMGFFIFILGLAYGLRLFLY